MVGQDLARRSSGCHDGLTRFPTAHRADSTRIRNAWAKAQGGRASSPGQSQHDCRNRQSLAPRDRCLARNGSAVPSQGAALNAAHPDFPSVAQRGTRTPTF